MPLRPYADRPGRFALQVVGDVLVAAWTAAWIWVAFQVHDAVVTLSGIGVRLRDGAGGISSNLAEAGNGVRRVPLVGDALAHPLTSAAGAAQHVAGAGQQLATDLTGFALWLAVGVAVLAIVPLAGPWLALRWRYARRAGAAAGLATSPGGARLLALRAMANQPARRLIAIDPDPVAAWDRRDPAVITALARLELRQMGLRHHRLAATMAAVSSR
jgi:hypothetical protein